MTKKIKIKYARSVIGRNKKQKETVKCLGFTKLNQVREIVDTPSARGMINKVFDLVEIVHQKAPSAVLL